MEYFYTNLKSRFSRGEIIKINDETIKVNFKNSKEPVIIQKEENFDRYTVSYAELIIKHDGKRVNHYTTINNILEEGVFWILSQVDKNGKVLPEF